MHKPTFPLPTLRPHLSQWTSSDPLRRLTSTPYAKTRPLRTQNKEPSGRVRPHARTVPNKIKDGCQTRSTIRDTAPRASVFYKKGTLDSVLILI